MDMPAPQNGQQRIYRQILAMGVNMANYPIQISKLIMPKVRSWKTNWVWIIQIPTLKIQKYMDIFRKVRGTNR